MKCMCGMTMRQNRNNKRIKQASCKFVEGRKLGGMPGGREAEMQKVSKLKKHLSVENVISRNSAAGDWQR